MTIEMDSSNVTGTPRHRKMFEVLFVNVVAELTYQYMSTYVFVGESHYRTCSWLLLLLMYEIYSIHTPVKLQRVIQ